VAWLLDLVPPDYRLHGVLQRHPIALATLARRHLAACVEGARQGYRTARTELGGVLPVSGVDAVLAAYRSEGHRLVTAARATDLVERALRGKEFTPQLHEAPGPLGQQGQQEQQERRDRREQQERQEQQARPEQQGRQARPEQPAPGKQKARQPTTAKQQQPVKQPQSVREQPVKQQQKPATAAPSKQRRKQAVS
jgi:outer membrane biosynthesis protein TonB